MRIKWDGQGKRNDAIRMLKWKVESNEIKTVDTEANMRARDNWPRKRDDQDECKEKAEENDDNNWIEIGPKKSDDNENRCKKWRAGSTQKVVVKGR